MLEASTLLDCSSHSPSQPKRPLSGDAAGRRCGSILAGLIPCLPGGFGVYEFFGASGTERDWRRQNAGDRLYPRESSGDFASHSGWLYFPIRRGLGLGASSHASISLKEVAALKRRLASSAPARPAMAAAWDPGQRRHDVTLYEAGNPCWRFGRRLQRLKAGTGGWRSFITTGSRPTRKFLRLAEEMVCASKSCSRARKPATG